MSWATACVSTVHDKPSAGDCKRCAAQAQPASHAERAFCGLGWPRGHKTGMVSNKRGVVFQASRLAGRHFRWWDRRMMQQFLERHADRIIGVLEGFDRVLFRGSMLSISYVGGLGKCLATLGIRYRRFADFVEGVSREIKEHAKLVAQEQGRPMIHLNSPSLCKEDLARRIAERDVVRQGLIAVFTCVQSCQSFGLRRMGEKHWMHLVPARRKNRLQVRGYYWTFRQSEYATDVMFRNEQALAEIYPRLVRHATDHFRSAEVLRFLGRRTNRRFNGQVTSDVRTRPEGMRIKHRVEENSVKMYDKQGSVLRIETTVNHPERFKVRREATRKGQLEVAWVPMRKRVADIARRVDVCRAANERYLEAIGVVGEPSPARQLLDPVSRRITRGGRP
jgi:hypothetical protein